MAKKVAKGQLTVVSLKDGLSSYLHRAWSNSADGTKDFSTKFKEGARYIGTYTSSNQQPSSNPKDYDWTPLFDNVVIGQRNLLMYSNAKVTSKNEAYNFLSYKSGKDNGSVNFKLNPNTTYTLTFRGTASSHGELRMYVQKPDKWDFQMTFGIEAGLTKTVSKTFTIPSHLPYGADYSVGVFDMARKGGAQVEWAVLTEGNVPATDWFPSPEEIQEANNLNKKDINSVKTRFENQVIGGVNRLPDSESPKVKPYGSSTVVYNEGIKVPEWNAENAVEATISKGDNTIFGTLRNFKESLKDFTHYTHSIYIKNTGTHPFRINSNTGASETTVQPNEMRRVILHRYHDDVLSAMQFVFTRFDKNHEIKFIAWHAQIEEGNIVTDWSPAPEDIVNKVDSLKIGGTNLLSARKWTKGYQTSDGKLNTSSPQDVAYTDDIIVGNEKTYTLQAWINDNKYVTTGLIGFVFFNGDKFIKRINYGKFVKGSNVIRIDLPEGTTMFRLSLPIGEDNIGNVKYKLEVGSIPSDWSPAPEDMENRLDSMVVGSRNLLLKSNDKSSVFISSNNGALFPINDVVMKEGDRQFRRITRSEPTKNPTNFSIYSYINEKDLTKKLSELNDGVVISFKARASKDIDFKKSVVVNKKGVVGEDKEIIKLTTKWQSYSARIKDVEGDKLTFIPAFANNPKDLGDITKFYLDICDWKVEEGNTPTAWSPAPEDMDKEINDRIDNIKVGARNLLVNKFMLKQNYINNQGQVTSWVHTNIYNKSVLVKDVEKVVFQFWNNKNDKIIDMAARINFFDDKGVFISQTDKLMIADGYGAYHIDIPAKAHTVKVHAPNLPNVKYKLEIGSIPTDWTPAPEDVEEDMKDKIDGIKIGARNKVISSGVTEKRYIDDNGDTVSGGQSFLTDFIKVNPSEHITFSQLAHEGVYCRVTYHDANKKFVKRELLRGRVNTITIPSGIQYIRWSPDAKDGKYVEGYQVESGNKATEWSPAPEDIDYKIENTESAAVNRLSFSNEPHKMPIIAQAGVANMFKVYNYNMESTPVKRVIKLLDDKSTWQYFALDRVAIYRPIALVKGNTWTFAGHIHSTKDAEIGVSLIDGGGTNRNLSFGALQLKKGWNKVNMRAVVDGVYPTDNNVLFFSTHGVEKDTSISIEWISLINGSSNIQQWTPAPEDLRNELNKVKDNFDNQKIGGRNWLRNSEAPKFNRYQESIATYSAKVKVPEWKADNCMQQKYSGGKSTVAAVLVSGTTPLLRDNTEYVHSMFIKNIGKTKFMLTANGGKPFTIEPNTSQRVVIKQHHLTNLSSMQFVIQRFNIADEVEFIAWHGQIEEGNIVTDWSPAPEDIEQKVDNIKVGGRNLLPQTKGMTVNNSRMGEVIYDDSLVDGFSVIKTVPSGATPASYRDTYSVRTITNLDSEEYVLSFWAKSNKENTTAMCYFYSPNTTKSGETNAGVTSVAVDGSIHVKVGTTWSKHWIKWKQSKTQSKKEIIIGRIFDKDTQLYITMPQLEEGNMVTDWTPAPQDMDERIDNLKFGGRNLLRNADNPDSVMLSSNDNSKYPKSREVLEEKGKKFTRIRRTNLEKLPTTFSIYSNINVKNLTQDITKMDGITVSFKARASRDVTMNMMVIDTPRPNGEKTTIDGEDGKNVSITREWSTISAYIPSPKGQYLRVNPLSHAKGTTLGDLATFYLDIADYKVEEGNMATAFSLAPEDLSEKVDSMKVGARNLWVESDCEAGYTTVNGAIAKSTAAHQSMKSLINITPKETLAIQIWNPNKVKNVSNSNRLSYFDKDDNWIGNSKNFMLTGEEYELHFVEVPDKCTKVRLGLIQGVSSKDNTIRIKVEKGTMPTDWTPAPEDMIEADNNNTKYIAEVEETAKKVSTKLAEVSKGVETNYSKIEQTAKGFKEEILSIKDVIETINKTSVNFIKDSTNLFKRVLLDNRVNVKVYYKTYKGELIKSETLVGRTGKQLVVKANVPPKYVLQGNQQQLIDVGEKDLEVTFIVEAEIIYADGVVQYKDGNSIVKTENVSSVVGKTIEVNANIPANYRLVSGETAKKSVTVDKKDFVVVYKIERIPAVINIEYIQKGTSNIISRGEVKTSMGLSVVVKASLPKNYQIVGADSQTVAVKATTQTVKFSIEKIPATIVVEYFDKQKNKVITTKEVKSLMGDVATINAEVPLGYVIVGANSIKITVDNIKKTHRFIIEEKKDTPAQIKVVYYVENESKTLNGETINTFIDKTVSVTAKVPAGYTLKGEGSKSITVKKTVEEVRFTINKIIREKANITVKYVLSKGGAAVSTHTINSLVDDVVTVKADKIPNNYKLVGANSQQVKVVKGGNVVEFIIARIPSILIVEYYDRETQRVISKESYDTFVGDTVPITPKAQSGYDLDSTSVINVVIDSESKLQRINMTKKKNLPPAVIRTLFFDLESYNYLPDMPMMDTYIGEKVLIKPKAPAGYRIEGETEKMVEAKNSHNDVVFNVMPDSSAKPQGRIIVNHVDSVTGHIFKTETFVGDVGSTQLVSAQSFREFPEYKHAGTEASSFEAVFRDQDTTHTFRYVKETTQTPSGNQIIIQYVYNGNIVHTSKIASTTPIGSVSIVSVNQPPLGYELLEDSSKRVSITSTTQVVQFKVGKVLTQMEIRYTQDGAVVKTDMITGYEGEDKTVTFVAPSGFKLLVKETQVVKFTSTKYITIAVEKLPDKPKLDFDPTGSYITDGEKETKVDGFLTRTSMYNLSMPFSQIINSSYKDLELVFTIVGDVPTNASFALVGDSIPYTKQFNNFKDLEIGDGRYAARFPFYDHYKSSPATKIAFEVRNVRSTLTISKVTLKHVGREDAVTQMRPDLTLFSSGAKNGSFEKIDIVDIDNRVKKDGYMTFSLYAKPTAPYYLRLGIIDETGKETFKDSAIKSGEGYIEVTEMIREKYRAVNIYLANDSQDKSNEILYKHVQAELGSKRTNWVDEGSETREVIERITRLEKTAEGLESTVSSKVLKGMDEIKEWADSRISQTDKSIEGKVSTEKSYGGFKIGASGAKLETNGMEVRLDKDKGFEIIKKSNPIKTIFQVDKDGKLTFNASGGNVTGGETGKVDTDIYQAWADDESGFKGFTRVKPTQNLLPSRDRISSLTSRELDTNMKETIVGTEYRVQPDKAYTFSIDLKNKKYGSTPLLLVGVGYGYNIFSTEVGRSQAAGKDGRYIVKLNISDNVIKQHGDYLTYKILNNNNAMELEFGNVKLEDGHVNSTVYSSTPMYTGYSSKDSMNNNDYRWMMNPEVIGENVDSALEGKVGALEYQNDIEQIYQGLSDKATIEGLQNIAAMTQDIKDRYQDFIKDGGQYSTDLEALEKRTAAIVANMGDQVARYEFISKYITMGQEGLLIGDSTSMMKILISEDKISFIDSGQEIAYMKGQEFKINRGTILESLQVGTHRMEQLDDYNTVFRFIN